jgi:sucrose phosphorylase
MLSSTQKQNLQKRLSRLYGDRAPQLVSRFHYLMGRYGVGLEPPARAELWDHRTSILITYADSIRREGEHSLQSLQAFCRARLKGVVSTIHILPFFPWSSDDGFSVIDFREVQKDYGNWADVERLGDEFGLMFDLVLNHCSAKSQWFRDYVTGIAPARWYFLPMDPKTDLSAVVRPRPWPLPTKTSTRDGPAHVWTTFSADQVDLNWQNPDVLFEFLDILFLYLSKGCRIFRLDAVAFLWKQLGTSCLHLPETHEIVKLFRDVLNIVAPDAILLTETNVPHEENISYFGDNDEAHMVYNFSLPPLLLHALLKENGTILTQWARSLPGLSPEQTFFNFTASHDGIGVRPLQGLVPDKDIKWLAEQVKKRGGRVSMKANSDGTQSPYELNISYIEALRVPEDTELSLARFLLSQAIVLAFKGIPALYIHSLLGTGNDYEGMEQSGENRSINRKKWDADELLEQLDDPDSVNARNFRKLSQWLQVRGQHPAFHPGSSMDVLDLGPGIFAFMRTSRTGAQKVLCLFNLTSTAQEVKWIDCFPGTRSRDHVRELLSNKRVGAKHGRLMLKPFHASWLMVKS